MNIKFYKKIFKKNKPSLDAEEQDYKINITALKRRLVIRLLSGILGVLLMTLFVFTTVSLRSFNEILEENLRSRISATRDLKIQDVKTYYYDLERNMSRFIRSGNVEVSEMDWDEYKTLGIEEIAVITGEYDVYYSSVDEDLLPIKKEIKSLKFQDPFYANEPFIDNDTMYQHLFYKLFDGFDKVKYLYFRINNTRLNKILTSSNFKGDILNDEFYIVASSRILESTEFVINDITKKILDGRVGEEVYEGKLYSYSFLEVGETSLYIQLYEDEINYKAPILRYKNKLYVLWVISLLAILSTIIFIKISIESYGEGVSRIELEKEGNKRYKFLKKDIKNIFGELDDTEEALEKMSSFTKNIGDLKKRIEHQNRKTLEKIDNQKQIIEEINSDEDLKKDVKENIE